MCDNPIEYGLFKNYIHIVRKLIFSALTGTGKTTVFLKRIANDTAFLAENGIERIVYLTPTNSIGKQQELEHKIPFMTSLHKENSDEINQSKVIAWTYDQVHKIPSHWLNDTLFVCDEMHTVITEFGYRKETMRGITDLLEKAKFFVGITATPNKEFIKKFNLSYCVAQYNDKNKAQKINITPILIKKGSAKDLTQDIIARRNKTKTTVIIHNNFNELLAFKDALTQKFGNDAITLISSKEHEFCRDNANYESLKRTGKVAAKTQFILTTKFLEAGVNFAFDSEIFCVHPESTVNLLQGVARPRIDRKTGVNSTVNCFVYLSTTNLDKALLDNSITRFQSFLDGKGYDIPPSVLAHLSDLKTAFENAEKICIAWNVVNDNTTKEHIEKANRFDVFFNAETRLWEIDKLGILSKVEANLQGNLKKDIVSFFAEIKALNESVTIQPLELISLKKDLEVRTIYDNLKTEKAESIDTVAQALTNAQSQKDILLIAYAESNNKALKTGILDTMLDQTPTKPEIEAAKQRTQFNAKDGGVICEVTTKYLGILEAAKTVRYANGTKPISQTDIDTNFLHLIQNYDLANNRLIRLGQRLMCERNHQERQDIDDFYEGKMSNAIRKRVFEATTKNKHKNPILNKTQMTNIYNESLRAVYLEMNIKKAPPSERKFEVVRQTFLELFSIETRRNKNGYFYKFGDEITAKNAVLVSSYT